MTQEQHIRRILQLRELNPELPIHFRTNAEDPGGEYGYSLQHITEVSVCPWYVHSSKCGDPVVHIDEETIRDLIALDMEEGTREERAARYQETVSQAIVVTTTWEEHKP